MTAISRLEVGYDLGTGGHYFDDLVASLDSEERKRIVAWFASPACREVLKYLAT